MANFMMTNSEEFDHPDDDVAEEDNKHKDSGEDDKQSETEYKDPTKYEKKSPKKQIEAVRTASRPPLVQKIIVVLSPSDVY